MMILFVCRLWIVLIVLVKQDRSLYIDSSPRILSKKEYYKELRRRARYVQFTQIIVFLPLPQLIAVGQNPDIHITPTRPKRQYRRHLFTVSNLPTYFTNYSDTSPHLSQKHTVIQTAYAGCAYTNATCNALCGFLNRFKRWLYRVVISNQMRSNLKK